MTSVSVAVVDHVATVTFSRPPVNALDQAAFADLRDTFATIADDPDVRIAILTATGTRAFMAGVDLKTGMGGRGSGESPDESLRNLDPGKLAREAFSAVYECGIPVIAAINGPAIGAGIAFVAVCDILIASESATFGTTEINVGLLGAFNHLARLVGPYRARRMFLSGDLATAAQLHEWGAVDRVVPPDDVLPAATELARAIAAKSPIAIRLAKESIVRTEGLDLTTAYRLEQDYTARLMQFDDAREATAAYLEKRDPNWRFR